MASTTAEAGTIDYRTVIESESARFASLVEAGPVDAPVAGAPGWNLRDLGAHLGDVQRWAAATITTGGPTDDEYAIGDQLVGDWVREGTATLLAAIDAADPAAPCWNLWDTGEKVVGFWFRRQALEVAVHRWDAERAVSDTPTPIEAVIAADVIDEWARVGLPRTLDRQGVDLASIDGDAHLHCTDTHGEWTLEVVDGRIVVSAEHRKSAVAARGPASDLALFCYGRIDGDGLEIFGERSLLDRWLGRTD